MNQMFVPWGDSYTHCVDTIGIIINVLEMIRYLKPTQSISFDQMHRQCKQFVIQFTNKQGVCHYAVVIGDSFYDSYKMDRKPTCRPLEGDLLRALQNCSTPENTEIISKTNWRLDYVFTGMIFYLLEKPSM